MGKTGFSTQSLSKLLQIKLKPRDDNILDQYSRIFMVKILLACCLVCSINWYSDGFNCTAPQDELDAGGITEFIASTCWMQGIYIYEELANRSDVVSYFGVTSDFDQDGMLVGHTELCEATPNYAANDACRPLTKTFFLQYQYMPFLLGVLAILYYLPYLVFKSANDDIVKLQVKIKCKNKASTKADEIFRLFFKSRNRNFLFDTQLSSRHLQIMCVKIFYVAVNVGVLFGLNAILHGRFIGYGGKMIDWYKQNHTERFDYMGSTEHPKPANEILPPFGYCELYSSDKQITASRYNHLKVVCEVSEHVLYQYALVLLWFCIIAGIIISLIGFLIALGKIICGCLGLRKIGEKKEIQRIYSCVTNREIDYLQMIKRQDLGLYGELVEMLTTSCNECTNQTCSDERLLLQDSPVESDGSHKLDDQHEPSESSPSNEKPPSPSSSPPTEPGDIIPWNKDTHLKGEYHVARSVKLES